VDELPDQGPQHPGVFDQSFTWTELGQLASLTYPGLTPVNPGDTIPVPPPSRTVTYTYTNGVLTDVPAYTGASPGITYHDNGMVEQVTHANGVTDTFARDANWMRRPASITMSGAVSNNWSSGTYAYDGAGNVTAIGGQWYVYDKVSRLTQANLGGADTRRYAFDPFGTSRRVGGGRDPGCRAGAQSRGRGAGGCVMPTHERDRCSRNITRISTETVGKDHAPAQQIAVDATSNRLAASSYDAAGNQTTWGGYHYAWYPTSQMRQMQGDGIVSIHGYSADGERIGTYTVGGPFAGGITYTLRDLSGKVIREVEELGGVWSWKKDYVYRDGQQLASVEPGGVVKHFHLDHLGTVRRVVTSHDYWPFGEEATDPYADSERMKFTGHERDLRDPEKTTDDLDYMHARYYSPNLGRFLSVDHGAPIAAVPGSWNRFAYALGSPLTRRDPTGSVAAAVVAVPVVLGIGTIAAYLATENPTHPGQTNAQVMADGLRSLVKGAVTAAGRTRGGPRRPSRDEARTSRQRLAQSRKQESAPPPNDNKPPGDLPPDAPGPHWKPQQWNGPDEQQLVPPSGGPGSLLPYVGAMVELQTRVVVRLVETALRPVESDGLGRVEMAPADGPDEAPDCEQPQ